MSRSVVYLTWLASPLLAGCAGAPANTAADAATAAEPAAVAAVAGESNAAAAAGESSAAPLTVVDGNALAQRSEIVCKEMLKPNSNVHINQCMTPEGWKRWERLEAQRAGELVRMMQGGRYR